MNPNRKTLYVVTPTRTVTPWYPRTRRSTVVAVSVAVLVPLLFLLWVL